MRRTHKNFNDNQMDSFLAVSPIHESNNEVLPHVLNLMEGLISWLIQSGIGYTEFSQSLKLAFFNQAVNELEKLNQKKTDSSLSLLSGLNRRDVSSIRQQYGDHVQMDIITNDILATSVPARVISLWIGSKLSQSISISEFENLVLSISSEKHPRSILSELKRLGLVLENDNLILLNSNSFTPTPEMSETKALLVSNIKDHLNAGLFNINNQQDLFLEQAIYADELTEKSILHLKKISYELWQNYSKKILDEAIVCCKEDEGRRDAINSFKLGIYEFDSIKDHHFDS